MSSKNGRFSDFFYFLGYSDFSVDNGENEL